MVVTASLPFGVWLLLAVGLLRRGRGVVESLLLAAVLLGLGLAGLCEGLELLLDGWARPGLLHGVWVLLTVGAAVYALRPLAAATVLPRPRLPKDPVILALLIGLALLALALLVVAFGSPPNTFDVQSYHLTRVRMWVQQGGIAPYASPDPRHVFMGPLPPWFQLQLRVLAGSDSWANIPQLWAWLLTTLAAGSIARSLGADERLRWVAAAFAASLPMAVLQAATAMTDLFVTMWLVLAAALLFARAFGGSRDGLTLVLGGAALGLAVLTKGTGLVHGAAIGAGWVAAELWAGGWRPGARRGLVAAVAVVLLCTVLPSVPGGVRNARLFGSPVAPADQQAALLNQVHGPRFVAFNLVRSGVMQIAAPRVELSLLGSSSTERAPELNRWLENYNRWLVARTVALGVAWGIPDGDPRVSSNLDCGLATPTGCDELGQRFVVHAVPREEDTAINPLHFLLALGALPLLLLGRRTRPRGDLVVVGATLVLAVLLFCFQIKWQVWSSRQLLPLFALAAPWSAVVLARLASARLAAVVGGLLLLLTAPFALQAEMRPLWGPSGLLSTPRAQLRYNSGSYLEPVFDELVAYVQEHDVRVMGLVTRWSTPSYHCWTAFEDRGLEPPTVRYLDLPELTTSSFALPDAADPRPDVVLAFFVHQFPDRVRVHGVPYVRVKDWTCGMSLYAPE